MPLSGRKANSITCDSLTCCLPPLSHMFVCLFVCLFTCLFVQQKKTTALPFTEYLLLPPPLTQRHTHLFVSFLPVCMFVCQPEKTTAFLPVRISPAASPPPSGRTLPVVVLGSKPTSVIVILPQANSLNSHQKQNRPQKCAFSRVNAFSPRPCPIGNLLTLISMTYWQYMARIIWGPSPCPNIHIVDDIVWLMKKALSQAQFRRTAKYFRGKYHPVHLHQLVKPMSLSGILTGCQKRQTNRGVSGGVEF